LNAIVVTQQEQFHELTVAVWPGLGVSSLLLKYPVSEGLTTSSGFTPTSVKSRKLKLSKALSTEPERLFLRNFPPCQKYNSKNKLTIAFIKSSDCKNYGYLEIFITYLDLSRAKPKMVEIE
jgi:hypothetical protein